MNRLLKLKHWQLFLLTFGIPFILQFVFAAALAVTDNAKVVFSIIPIITLVSFVAFFGWLYALATNLQRLLPDFLKMNIKRFKIFLFVPTIYISVLCILIFFMFNHTLKPNAPINIKLILTIFSLIIPIHLFSIFCILYSLYFTAKALKTLECQCSVSFGDFVGEFFLLWFYPVGIWIIQPRVNKIFKESNDLT